MRIFLGTVFALCSSVCYATGTWVPVNQPQVVVQEQIITTTVQPQVYVPQVFKDMGVAEKPLYI